MKNLSIASITCLINLLLLNLIVPISYSQEKYNEATRESSIDSLLSLDFKDLLEIEVINIVGSRSTRARDVIDFPVPVDIFSVQQFNSLGNSVDITDNLKSVMPSFSATPATGDGSAFVRPTSLRGMSPDQTLVLINGKRRHRSSLVHFFAPASGNGAHGPDIGLIPDIALKSVEILRDGAAAQYGSDAIAGVINFVMRDNAEGGEFQVQYGEYYQGEQSVKLSANTGFSLSESGYINLSIEHSDNQALSRGIQRPDAQDLIDAGVEGVGIDSPFGDSPLVQTWGRPETQGTRFFVNSGIEFNQSAKIYLQGNYAKTKGRYRFFYRSPNHSSLLPLRNDGFTGLQAGYTPYLDGDQTDSSLLTGIKGFLSNGTYYDFSLGYGQNKLTYFLYNTINPTLGLVTGFPAQRDFSVGGYEQKETNLNIDFSTPINLKYNLAYGLEWREEVYVINPGEENSYQGAGASGLNGFRPQDSGRFNRDNYSMYADLEQDYSDALLFQYALRYESFSDFGDTINGKLATRYKISDILTLRGAVSTGFHAPTPGQANIRATITTFDGSSGLQTEEGLVPATSPQASSVGGTTLKEEVSKNISLGMTAIFSDTSTLTLDLYRIKVNDRIYRTGDILLPSTGGTISFYTNALDIRTSGLDIVLKSSIQWPNSATSDLSFAYNYGKTEVLSQSQVGGVNPVSAATIEDIENNYPHSRFVLSSNTVLSENWNLMLRANYFGEHHDERGSINAVNNPSAKIASSLYLDMELSYLFTDRLRITLGATNIFDEYVDTVDAPNANRMNVGLPYPRRSVANYEGGSWYLRGNYRF